MKKKLYLCPRKLTRLLYFTVKKYYLFLVFAIAAPAWVCGQSVKCSFTLNAQKVQNAGNEVFDAMKSAVTDFLNTNTWVDRELAEHERFECNVTLTISEQTSETTFKGMLQVQAQRPVYGSAYNSVIINAIDNDVAFTFSPNAPLDFSLMSHQPDNLTPLLAYWIYFLIGLDGDTFAPLGGTEIFRTADRIVQNAQTDNEHPGWVVNSGAGNKNRFALTESTLNKRYEKARLALYAYHRLGLDRMSSNATEGKKSVLAALQNMQEVYKDRPDNAMYFIALFFDAKADEIVNIFSESDAKEKDDVYKMLMEMSVINELKYKRLKQ
jgi:hypothetical protein